MDVSIAGVIAAPDLQFKWPPPPRSVDLSGGQIHVWCAGLSQGGFHACLDGEWLGRDEKERAAKFHFDRDRRSFVARRSFLRAVLGRYLDLAPSQVPLACEQWGKPRLATHAGLVPLHFNFSHSRGLALCAVSRLTPLGVDVEKLRPMPEMAEIGATFCSARENAQILAAPEENKLEVFFTVWTRKEAYLKATGQGIAGSLAQIDCSEAAPGWTLETLAPAHGFVGSLAYPRPAAPLECWQWELRAR